VDSIVQSKIVEFASYAESILSYIKSYKLGTIVGETTAGTNGNINSFNLIGGYSMRWTNAICYMQTGEAYFGKGIEPGVFAK
jgi:C-terminal processing protease CtpA/Prc